MKPFLPECDQWTWTSAFIGQVQEELDRIGGVDRVLLGFGFCGNAVAGLRSRSHQLVIPRVDDCITLLLGSRENRELCNRQGGTYFLTKGRLDGEANIWKEYRLVVDRFGPARTQMIYKKMLAHYKFLGMIDTGAYDLPGLLPRANEISAPLNLELCIHKGNDIFLKRLLLGPWGDDRFIIIPPSTTIDLSHLGLEPAINRPFVQSQPLRRILFASMRFNGCQPPLDSLDAEQGEAPSLVCQAQPVQS